MEDEALACLDQGKLGRAAAVLKRMLSLDPNSVAAHFNLTRVYWRTRRYDLAVKHAHRVLRLSPDERHIHLNLGLVYDLMGRDELARLHYRKELIRNPNSAETLWNLGRLHFRRHRWKQARVSLQKCFDLRYPFRLDETVHLLGSCYAQLGDVKSYVRLYERFVELQPAAAWAFANLGCALLKAGDPKSAVHALTQAIRLGCKSDVKSDLERARALVGRVKLANR